MTGKDFFNNVAGGGADALQVFLDLLEDLGVSHCVIGGLAVNAYAEPVVSLDLDVVIVAAAVDEVIREAERSFRIKSFPHSVNLAHPESDLRIQLQIDPRYQEFLGRAVEREVLGYRMKVAALEDVLQGKIWAYLDASRRMSKRQKYLADIYRLVEAYPELRERLPEGVPPPS